MRVKEATTPGHSHGCPFRAGKDVGYPTAVVVFVGLVMAGLASSGCTQTLRVEQADQGEKVEVDAFLHDHLQKQPMVTVGEAYRAMVILADGDDRFHGFDERRAALEERGIVRREWNLRREACIDKGSVAYMVCRAIKVPGGINYNTLGRLGIGDRRYALRELVSLGLMPNASPHRYITGGELVDLAAKADRYMAEHGMYAQEKLDVRDLMKSQASQPAK